MTSTSSAPIARAATETGEQAIATPRHSIASSSPSIAAGLNWSEWWQRLQSASTFTDGFRVMFEVVPPWVPLASVLATAGAYYINFRVRLFISQWRIAERRRAERKYELLDHLRGMTSVPAGAVHALGDDDDDDDDDDEEDEMEDETAVSRRDFDEFRSSLGIRLPRDEDLMAIVEKMLMSDSLPDGWVLYRTSAGIIRFMNLNTQELLFFPPNKRKEKALIESELKKRNREAMESRYNFSYEDEGMNSSSLSPSNPEVQAFIGDHHSPQDSAKAASGPMSPLDFNHTSDAEGGDEVEASAFTRVFNYFLEREQRKIEQDVARARTTRDGGHTGSSGAGSGGAGANGAAGNGANNNAAQGGAAGTGAAGHESTSRRASTAMTYRVVSSGSMHNNRGGAS